MQLVHKNKPDSSVLVTGMTLKRIRSLFFVLSSDYRGRYFQQLWRINCQPILVDKLDLNNNPERLVMLNSAIRRLLGIFAALALLAGVQFYADTASAQTSECKGLSKSACTRNDNCSHVGSYTRSDGTKVKSFCRRKPGKGSSSAAKKVKKKKPTTKAKKAKSGADTPKTKTKSAKKPRAKKKKAATGTSKVDKKSTKKPKTRKKKATADTPESDAKTTRKPKAKAKKKKKPTAKTKSTSSSADNSTTKKAKSKKAPKKKTVKKKTAKPKKKKKKKTTTGTSN